MNKSNLNTILICVIAYSIPFYLIVTNVSEFRNDPFNRGEYGRLVFEQIEDDAVIVTDWGTYTLLSYFKYVVYEREDVDIFSLTGNVWLSNVDQFYGERPVYITGFNEEVALNYQVERLNNSGMYYVVEKIR